MLDFGESVVVSAAERRPTCRGTCASAEHRVRDAAELVQRGRDLLRPALEASMSRRRSRDGSARAPRRNGRGRPPFLARASTDRRTPSRRTMPRIRGNTTVPADSTHSSSGGTRESLTIAGIPREDRLRARRESGRSSCSKARRAQPLGDDRAGAVDDVVRAPEAIGQIRPTR